MCLSGNLYYSNVPKFVQYLAYCFSFFLQGIFVLIPSFVIMALTKNIILMYIALALFSFGKFTSSSPKTCYFTSHVQI